MSNNLVYNPQEKLSNFLQKEVRFTLGKKQYKAGKIILFNTVSFCFHIKLHNTKKNKIEIVKIPFPFNYEYHPEQDILYFDYRISSLLTNNNEVTYKILNIGKKTKSRYWNSILEISLND